MNAYMVALPKGRYWSAFRSHRSSVDRINTTATRSIRTSQIVLTTDKKIRPSTKEKKKNTEPSNYIQLIKRPSTQIDILQRKYTRSLDCINIIGSMVSQSIEFLDALRNFWIIPLFLMFKRMVQLRLEVERFLEAQINSYNIDNWKEVCNSRDYLLFLSKIKSDNRIVRDEMKLLLGNSLPKTKCLDKVKRERVLYFLNDNLEVNIKQVCLSYMKDQLLILVRQRKGINKKPIEWLKLQLCVQASIFVAQQPVLVCESGEFSYDFYTRCQKSDDQVLISQYIEKLNI